jgi:hypothetical protein
MESIMRSVHRRKNVLNLRPKRLHISVGKEELHKVIRYAKKHTYFSATIAIAFVILVGTLIHSFSIASTLRMYASSCLGGWQNTQLAEGQPQTENGEDFSRQNSAVLDNSVAQIFCGGFKGDIENESNPTRVLVHFSSGIERLPEPTLGNSEPLVPADQATTTISSDNYASSTIEIIDLTTDTPTEFILTPNEEPVRQVPDEKPVEQTPSEEPAQTPDEEPAQTPDEEPAQPQPEESAPAAEPTSWLIKRAIAQELSPEEGFLNVTYTLDGKAWLPLGKISRAQLLNNQFEIPIDSIVGWSDISRLQISVESLPSLNTEPVIFLDSVWLEVEYEKAPRLSESEINQLPRVEVNENEVFDSKKDFRSDEDAEFEIDLSPTENQTIPTEEVTSTTTTSNKNNFWHKIADVFTPPKVIAASMSQKRIVKAELFGPDNSLYPEPPIVVEKNGVGTITIPQKGKTFRPGVYKLRVEILSGDQVLVTTREFGWGVLAINRDKSSYEKGESAYLQIGALTPLGHTLCDASLRLEIQKPNGSSDFFSTSDGGISKSGICAKNNVTDMPDYSLNYDLVSEGKYSLTLTNTENNFVINDSFEVKSDAPYVVKRVGATRINPFASTYEMNLIVIPKEAFQGTVVEVLPKGFSVTTDGGEVVEGSSDVEVSWNVNIKKGEVARLSYVYQAPQVSPELFLIGPALIRSQSGEAFQEERFWQLASDAACNAITTGNWSDGTKFSGCSGVGGVPNATDDVTINSGVTMTVNATAVANSITVAANGGAGNGLTFSSGITMTVTGNIAMISPTANASTIAVGAGILIVGGNITIPGSNTASRFATLSVSTGTITVSGSITFSGTAAQARVISTGASTISVGVNFTSGGTLTTSATGTIRFDGTGAQTIGAYTTYNNIEVNGTGNTVSTAGNATIGGTLSILSGTFSIGGHTVTVTGTTTITGQLSVTSSTGTRTFTGLVTINNDGTWSCAIATCATFRGGITNNGTFTSASNSAYTFTTNSQQLNGNAITAATITVTAVTLTSNVDLTATVALSGSGGLTMTTNTTLTLGGTSGITTLTVNASGVIVNYNGAAAQTIKATTYVTLKVNNSHASGATLAGGTTVTTLTVGDVTSSALFADGGFTVTLSGSSVLNLNGTYKLGSAGTATTLPNYGTKNINNGSTIEYAAGVAQTIDPALSYYSLTVSGAVAKTATGNLTIPGNLTVSNASQTFNLGAFTHSITGNIVISSTATLNASSSSVTLQGNLSGSGTLTGATSTFTFTGGNTQTLGATSQTFNNIVVNKTVATTLTPTVAITIGGTLTVNTGTYGMSNIAQTITGVTTVSDTILFTSATGAKTFTGNIIINSDGTWSNSVAAAVTMRGGLTYNGSSFTNTGRITFDTNGQIVSGANAFTVTAITVTGVTVTNNNTGGVSTADLTGTGGWTQGTNAVLTLSGTSAVTSFDASATGNTVNYTGGAQTIKPFTYHHLNISGTGTKTFTSVSTINGDMTYAGTGGLTTATAVVIGGNLAVNSGTVTVAGFDFTVTGTTTIDGGILAHSSATGTKIHVGSITLTSGSWTNAGSSAFTFRGGLTVDGGTFTSGTGVYTFDTNDQNIGGSQAFTIGSITVTTVNLTNTSTVGLTISTALAGTGTFTQAASTVVNIGGSVGITNLAASADGNIVNYSNASAGLTVKGTTYYTLKVNNIGGTLGATTTLTHFILGDTLSTAVFYDGTGTLGNTSRGINLNPGSSIIIYGTATYHVTNTSFPSFSSYTISTASTIYYDRTIADTVTVSSAFTYGNLRFDGAGGGSNIMDGNLDVAGSIVIDQARSLTLANGATNSVAGSITLTYGSFDVNGSLFIGGNLSISIDHYFYADSPTDIVTIQGNISGAGVYHGGLSASSNGQLFLTGTNAQTLSATTMWLPDLTVNKTSGTASITVAAVVYGDINVADGTLAITNTLTDFGDNVIVSDTLNITSTTGTKAFEGLITINSGGVWNNSANEAVTLRGGLTVVSGGTFTAGSGVHTFDTNNQIIGDGEAVIIPSVTVTGVTLTNNNTAGLTIATALSGTGGLTQGSDAILNIGGTSGITTLTATASGNTVNFTGGAQTVKATTYNDLSLSGSGTKTITSLSTINNDLSLSGTAAATTATALAIGGDLNVGTGAALTAAGFTFTVTGTTTVTGTLTISSSTGTKTFTGLVLVDTGGAWNNSGNSGVTFAGGITMDGSSFSSGQGTYTFSTNNQSISGAIAFTINFVSVSTGVNLTNDSTAGFTIGNSLSGVGTFTQGGNALLILDGTTTPTGFVVSASGNTVKYASTTIAQTVKAPSSSGDYYNLTIDKLGQTATLEADLRVDDDLTITAGTLDTSSGNNYDIVVKGDWSNDGTFTARNATVTFNGTGNQTINGSTTWYGLEITGSTARTVYFESAATQTLSDGGALTLTGAESNLLSLAPLTPSTDWLIRLGTGITQSISYVSPSFSDAGTLGVDTQIDASNGTNDDGGDNTNWNFSGTISFSISDNTVGFGTITPSASRYATGDTAGDGSETEAHTLTASSYSTNGYTISVQGASPSCVSGSIQAIGGSNTAPSVGTEQFGIRLTATGGVGSVAVPYAASGFAYGADASTPSVIASATTNGDETVYSVRYLANISSATDSCDYSGTYTFVMTPNF